MAELNESWRSQEGPTDVQGVMDGELDPFIQALLRQGVEIAADVAA
jgi:peptide chain release factor 2